MFIHQGSHWTPLIWTVSRRKGTRVTTVTVLPKCFPLQEAILIPSLRLTLAMFKAQPKIKLRSLNSKEWISAYGPQHLPRFTSESIHCLLSDLSVFLLTRMISLA